MIIDTSKCSRKILGLYGEAGQRWLDALPALARDLAQRWSLTLLPPFEYDSYSYVAPAIRANGEQVAFKVGVPDRELRCQMDTLRLVDGDGMVRLYEADYDLCAMVMERAIPGVMLAENLDDVENTRIAAGIMQSMWRPAPAQHDFQTVAGWTQGLTKLRQMFNGGYGPFPPGPVDKASALFKELLSEDQNKTLIHGDVNPFNILSATRLPWLVIDPKGVVGSPYYDIATFMSNIPEYAKTAEEITAVMDRRASQFAELLGFDRKLVIGWSQAHSILSGFWSYEDSGSDWEESFWFAELYDHFH